MAKKPTISKEVAALADARDILKAVQLQIKLTHQNLKEAKDAVDAYCRGEYVVEGTDQGPSFSDLCDKIAELIDEETHDSILEAANLAEDLYDILLDSDLDGEDMTEMVDTITISINVAILISVPEKYDEAAKKLQKLLDDGTEGNLAAYCHYGLYVAYSAGRGVKVDEQKAYDHVSAATLDADEGDNIELDIDVAMAMCYFNGWGVESDIESARMYYEMARDWKPKDPDDVNPVENVMTRFSLESYSVLKEMLEQQTVTVCSVMLTDIGSDKREIRNFLVNECGKSVDEAVKLMIKIKAGEAFLLADGISKEEADERVARVEAAGGTAEVEEKAADAEVDAGEVHPDSADEDGINDDDEGKTIGITLTFSKGTGFVKAYPVTDAIREYIDENGLRAGIFSDDKVDEFGEMAKLYCGKSECGELNVEGIDESFEVDSLETTSLPLDSDALFDAFNDSDDYDEMVEKAGGDEDEAYQKYAKRMNKKATRCLDEKQRELYDELYEEENYSFVLRNFIKTLEHLNDDCYEKYVYWLANGRDLEFAFNIPLKSGEQFDIDKLRIVACEDWFDDDYSVFIDTVDFMNYSVFPEWIMYDGKLIHSESAEYVDMNTGESKVVLTDDDMNIADDEEEDENEEGSSMNYHYCVHYMNDPDDMESIEDDFEAESMEEAKKYVLNELDHPLAIDYYTLESENGDWYSSAEDNEEDNINNNKKNDEDMAKFYLTNRIIEEYGVVMEADSLEEAIEKFYHRQDSVCDLGQVEEKYNELGIKEEIKEEYIKEYCEDNEKEIDELDESDWCEIISEYLGYSCC